MKIQRNNKTLVKARLTPIVVGDVRGFPLSKIQEYLSPQQFTKFQFWLIGQTVGVYRNKAIIYEYDFKRFMAGLTPLD